MYTIETGLSRIHEHKCYIWIAHLELKASEEEEHLKFTYRSASSTPETKHSVLLHRASTLLWPDHRIRHHRIRHQCSQGPPDRHIREAVDHHAADGNFDFVRRLCCLGIRDNYHILCQIRSPEHRKRNTTRPLTSCEHYRW